MSSTTPQTNKTISSPQANDAILIKTGNPVWITSWGGRPLAGELTHVKPGRLHYRQQFPQPACPECQARHASYSCSKNRAMNICYRPDPRCRLRRWVKFEKARELKQEIRASKKAGKSIPTGYNPHTHMMEVRAKGKAPVTEFFPSKKTLEEVDAGTRDFLLMMEGMSLTK